MALKDKLPTKAEVERYQRSMTSQTSELVEELAPLVADYVAWRRWDNMAEDRSDLRMKMREGDFDVNEPTKDDCRQAVRALLERLSSSEVTEEMIEAGYEALPEIDGALWPNRSDVVRTIYLAMRSAATSKEQHP